MSIPIHKQELIRRGVTLILEGLGESPTRTGLRDTPERIAKMYSDILDGAYIKESELKLTSFEGEAYEGSGVMVHHVPFYAYCEHHFALFQGHFGLAYIPKKKILGLSKLVRIFRYGCKRLTIQERITSQAVNLLHMAADCHGAICYVTAAHSCMCLRGVKSPGSMTTTIHWTGDYGDAPELRQQFIAEASK